MPLGYRVASIDLKWYVVYGTVGFVSHVENKDGGWCADIWLIQVEFLF